MNSSPQGTPLEVFRVFLKLGLSSFGGPVAHLSYFHRELIERRRWVSDSDYAQLMALCQFLPGPGSSQLGFCLGFLRAGWLGALAAFLGFTLPAAFILYAFACGLPYFQGEVGHSVLHGLKLVALVVVSHGLRSMATKLCPDAFRCAIATLAAVLVLLSGNASSQIFAVVLGGIFGYFLKPQAAPTTFGSLQGRVSISLGTCILLSFFLLLFGLPLLAPLLGDGFKILYSFFHSGALVFGGGHVVLPLLQESLVGNGWITQDVFLAGYGASQAIPGPMFAFSSFLGAQLFQGSGGLLWGGAALISLFLPGLLLVSGALPFWHSLQQKAWATRSVMGINAAVVGILGAALYQPIWLSSVFGPSDLAIALLAFLLLASYRCSTLWVVLVCVSGTCIRDMILS